MSYEAIKDDLYRSFRNTTERGFKDHQVELAKRYIEATHRDDVSLRYQMIPFLDLLTNNECPNVVTALNLLLQYITNLLPPTLPSNWWSISTKNTSYRIRLARVFGAADILKTAGYTSSSGDFVTFPESQRREPDRDHLARLATELLLARVECEGIIEKRFPSPRSARAQPKDYGHRNTPPFRQQGGPPDFSQPSNNRDLPPRDQGASYDHMRPAPMDQRLPQYEGGTFGFNPPYDERLPPQRSTLASSERRTSAETNSIGFDFHGQRSSPEYSSNQYSNQYPQASQPRGDYPYQSDHYRHPGPPHRHPGPPPDRQMYNPRANQTYHFSEQSKPLHQFHRYSDDSGLDRAYATPPGSSPVPPPSHPTSTSSSALPPVGQEQSQSDPVLHKERSSRELPDTNTSGSPLPLSEPSSRSSSQQRQYSGPQQSSGNSSPSPSSSQNTSGQLSVAPPFDRPPSGDSSEDRKATLKRRREEFLNRIKNISANDDKSDSVPSNPSVPAARIVPSDVPSATLSSHHPSIRNDLSAQRPVPKPRVRPSTSPDPAPPPSRPHVSKFESIGEEEERKGSAAPLSPTQCPRCNCQLRPDGTCPYCSLSSPPAVDTAAAIPPKPKPRTKLITKKPDSGEKAPPFPGMQPIHEGTNLGPLPGGAMSTGPPAGGAMSTEPPLRWAENTGLTGPPARWAESTGPPAGGAINTGPPSRWAENTEPPARWAENTGPPAGGAINTGPPARWAENTGPPARGIMDQVPPHKEVMGTGPSQRDNVSYMGPTHYQNPQPSSSVSSNSAEGEASGYTPVRSEVADQLHLKTQTETIHFRGLSLDEQREYLDSKRRYKEPINHLKPYYKGTDLHNMDKSREMEKFESMSPVQQRQLIKEKKERGESVDHLHGPFEELPDLKEREERKQRLKDDGLYFVHCLRHCAPYGFAPEEVQIALSQNYRDPLHYLQTTWLNIISDLKKSIKISPGGKESVGVPSDNELRLLLIECKGDRSVARKMCIDNRNKKIDELYQKIAGKFQVSRKDAAQALSECELEVEEAFYHIQRSNLNGLYGYLLSDYSKRIRDYSKDDPEGMGEMDYLKDMVLKRMEEKDPEGHFSTSCLRMVMAECRLKTLGKAEILVKLLKEDSEYPLQYYIDATKSYATFEDALKYLKQPCPICTMEYPMDEMVMMPACGESLCKDCFKENFKIVIKEKSVKHFTCPICNQPDLANNDQTQELNLQLFVAMVKVHLDKGTYEMCQKKLTDFSLSKDEGFVWCPHEECGAGFINDRRDRKKVECPYCHELMCVLCKKKWEDQHEGITCEQFAQWQTDNDPEAQKAGLAAILKANGIQCPGCNFRYDLARGGCMHFHCTQCPREFCSGCYGTYVKSADACGQGYCKKRALGLHAHHPRDCLFYLRDFSVKELQQLLEANKVEFDTDPHAAQVQAAKERKEKGEAVPAEVQAPEPAAAVAEGEGEQVKEKPVHVIDGEEIELVCQVMLQKETPNGLIDEECLTGAPQGMAGLCEVHYKEYLVDKINKNKVDPVELYSLNQLKLILTRVEIEVPGQDDDEAEDEYRKRLIELIKERLPLKRNEPEAEN